MVLLWTVAGLQYPFAQPLFPVCQSFQFTPLRGSPIMESDHWSLAMQQATFRLAGKSILVSADLGSLRCGGIWDENIRWQTAEARL